MIKKLFLSLALVAVAATPALAQNQVVIAEEDFEEDGDMIEAPGFTLKNLEGKSVSLSDFKGKWVVLDFWGSWCKWCIKGIPEMKEAYNAYHSKGLEIIGIDCGDTPEVWKEAVANYQLPWVNVYNPDTSNLTKDYAIQGYPTKIIINPEGYLYEMVIGEDPEFYEMLKQIFQ